MAAALKPLEATPAASSAKALYAELEADRSRALYMARECSRLTIPSLLPPDGTNNSTQLLQPYQSLGAYGVNNLASKLLLALYPPGTAFFRYILPAEIAGQAASLPPEQRAELEKRLAAAENRALQKFETSPIRPQKAEELLHLIVAGNVLTYFPSLEGHRVYPMDRYVVRRNAAGKPMDVVVRENVSPRSLPADVRAACNVSDDKKEGVDVYTAITWDEDRCRWRSEINDIEVPDSAGDSPLDISPWNPLRWKAVPGADYGRGHVEEYIGALQSAEGLAQSTVEFAAVASKIVFLVKPGSTTNVDDVNRARSGDAVAGNLEDIGVLQLDKYADFQAVNTVAGKIDELLSRAFLLRSGLVRDAERVTAEEIRATAQELEDTLGGVYTVLAQEEQMPFIRRHLSILQVSGEIPRFPKGAVDPVVVTGFQALGRNHSLNKLRGAIQDLQALFGAEAVIKLLQGGPTANRILLGWGVEDPSSIVKTADQIAQEATAEQQAAMRQTLLEKGTAPMVSGVMAKQ